VVLLQGALVAPALGNEVAVFKITASGIPATPLEKNDTFTLTLVIKRTSKPVNSGDNYSLTLSGSYEATDGGGLTREIVIDVNGNNATVKIPLRYDGGNRSDIEISIKDDKGKLQSITSGYLVRIPVADPVVTVPEPTVPEDTSKYVPVLNIVNSSLPSGDAGRRVRVDLTIKNTSIHTAKNIRVRPALSEGSPFTLDSAPVQTVEILYPNNTVTLSYAFRISPYAEAKVYPIPFDFEYFNVHNDFFGGSASPRTDVLYVSVNNYQSAPHLAVEGIRVLTPEELAGEAAAQSLPAQAVVAELTVANKGTMEARNVRVSLLGLKDDGFGLYHDTSLKTLNRMAGEDKATFRYTLLPAANLARGNYGLTAKIEYEDLQGKAYTAEHQFFVPVRSGAIANSVPKVIISQYSCEPAIAKAGERFRLNLSFLNTSKDKTVTNIKIYFTVPEGGTGSSGSVFSPVNSSNTVFIDAISPKGTYYQSLEFYTIPDAAPKTYTLTANFEYEDEAGKEYKATELIGIPVSQQVKLETSELVLPPEVFVGEPVAVSLDFYNTGKAKLSNLMLKLEGNFETQNATYYVGNFDVGASDYFEGMLIPNTPGPLEGAIVITYEDPSGEQAEIRKEFSLNAIEMVMPDMPPGVMPEDAASSGSSGKTWLIAGGTLLAALILAVVLYKKVIKKAIAKRKGLALDE